MEHEELNREQQERAEIARKVIEVIENDLWDEGDGRAAVAAL